MTSESGQVEDAGAGPRPNPMPDRRYVFDITELVRFAHRGSRFGLSGIPRILLLLAYYAIRLRPHHVKIGYFDNIDGFYKQFLDENILTDFEKLKIFFGETDQCVKSVKTWKYKRLSLSYMYHHTAYAISRYVKKSRRTLMGREITSSRRLDLGRGDCVVCLGASWNTPDLFRFLRKGELVKPGAADLVVLVPDMTPTLSECVTGVVAVPQFEHWLKEMMLLGSSFLVNSDSTLNDFENWCGRHDYNDVNIAKFAFGDEMILLSGNNRIRADVLSLEGCPYVLAVGPITGRKNGGNLIRAWRKLAARLPKDRLPLLVFAGNEAGDSVVRCGLNEDIAGWDKLRFICSPCDFDLHCLYKNCLFTVYPSLYEGWGLPISESLWHGKVCATSNVSSMPEVGGKRCEYFDPTDPDNMAQVIERLILDPTYLDACARRIDHAQLLTWEQAAKALLATLDCSVPYGNTLQGVTAKRPVALRVPVQFPGSAAN